MRRFPIAPSIFGASLAALTLSACGMMGGEAPPKAGEYKSEATMIAFEVPGMPPIPADKLNKPTPAGSACLSQEDIDKTAWQDAAKGMQNGMTGGADCKAIRDNNSPTSLDTEMQCTAPTGETFTVVMTGQTEVDSLTMKMAMTGKTAKGEDMKMITEFKSKRVGDCSPEAEEAKAKAAAAKAAVTTEAPIAPDVAPSKK